MVRRKKSTSEYPEINSTNFPLAIAEKFKKYKIKKDDSQPKKFPSEMTDDISLFSYQKIIEEYMNKDSPYRGLILYYGLGSGKTLTAINVAEQSGRDVVVLLPKSLRDNFVEEIIKYVPKFHRKKDYSSMTSAEKRKADKELFSRISRKYSFISSNASTSAQKLTEVADTSVINDDALGTFVKEVNSLDNKFLIIDEVHNLLVNMINAETKNGTKIYNMIMNAKNLKMLFLSGSPIVGDPFELAIMFNMLRGYMKLPNNTFRSKNGTLRNNVSNNTKYTVFPDYREFYEFFVDKAKNRMINQQLFKERIVGTVSYYGGVKEGNGERNLLPFRHRPITVRVPMSIYQWKVYLSARLKEQDEERKQKYSKQKFVKAVMKKPGRGGNTTFRVKTRIISNFALPPGIERPEFRKKEKASVYDKAYKEMLENIKMSDLKGKKLMEYSPKMHNILEKIERLPGNAFVYSQFISLEGIGIFAKVLEANGYTNYNKSKKSNTSPGSPSGRSSSNQKFEPGKTFVIFSGSTDDTFRREALRLYNSPENKNGKHIRVILATATMAEGVSLKNLRHIHIMEPYWNLSRLQQIIGRGVRLNSHKDLPKDEREVESFIYLSTAPKSVNMMKILNEKYTTDENIFINAKHKQELIDQFLKCMREAAIDCEANFTHNSQSTVGSSLIDECMVCIPSDQPLFIPNIEDHALPINRTCKGKTNKVLTAKLKTVTINNKKYKKDEAGNILELVPGKDNTYRIRKDLKYKSRSKTKK